MITKRPCAYCDDQATHCCSTNNGWLYFCAAHALVHRKQCPDCIAKRKDAGKAP